jgi:hypothetical protein
VSVRPGLGGPTSLSVSMGFHVSIAGGRFETFITPKCGHNMITNDPQKASACFDPQGRQQGHFLINANYFGPAGSFNCR